MNDLLDIRIGDEIRVHADGGCQPYCVTDIIGERNGSITYHLVPKNAPRTKTVKRL